MSLRNKYTKEEFDELEELILNSTNKEKFNFKGGMDKDIPNNKLDPKEYFFAENKAFFSAKTNDNLFLSDELAHTKTPYYNALPIPVNYNDKLSNIGKANLLDYTPLTKPGHKHEYPEINEDIKDAFSKYIKSETEIKKLWSDAFDPLKKEIKYACIINHMVNKILEKKSNGRIPEVAIMSINNYDSFMEYISRFKTEFKTEFPTNKTGVIIAGVKLLIHPSINANDGEIEIY